VIGYEFGTLLLFAAMVLWIALWIYGAVDAIRRRDLTVGTKILWLVVLLVLPLIGLVVYFAFSGRGRPA
jgi:Phospholipase_D-nuclease N-terminal